MSRTKKVYDSSLVKGNPASSKFITTQEWLGIYPEGIRRSKDFIFDPIMPLEIPEKEAYFIIKKYPELKLMGDNFEKVDTTDDLDEMPTRQMRILAERYYLNVFQKKNADIIFEIRQRREAGVVPMAEDLFKDHKYENTMKQVREEWNANNVKE